MTLLEGLMYKMREKYSTQPNALMYLHDNRAFYNINTSSTNAVVLELLLLIISLVITFVRSISKTCSLLVIFT